MNHLHRTTIVTACSFISMFIVTAASANNGISLKIEQQTDEVSGVATLIFPSQDSLKITKQYSLPAPKVGKYTLLLDSPNGYSTSIELYDNSALISTAESPQMSFDVNENSNVRIIVTYTLTHFGTIGVSTNPAGTPFILTEAGGKTHEGITPETLENMPIGEYSVAFKPKGCRDMPLKSDKLNDRKQIYFTATINCDTFEPVEKPSAGVDPKLFLFSDVDTTTWYAPYVYRITKMSLMAGYKDENGNLTGQFGPEKSVTLAELAKITHNLMGMHAAAQMRTDAWYTPFIDTAVENGWAAYMEPQLDPNRPATRGEVVVTLLQNLDLPVSWPKGTIFRDVTKKTPYAGAIETAAALGIVSGKVAEESAVKPQFGPMESINRAELSKILSIIMEKYRSR